MAIAKGDFVELDYTGSVAPSGDSMGFVFDTTVEETAKQAQIHSPRRTYGTITICVGEGQVLPGLENQLVGKNPNSSFKVKVAAAEAFGNKSAKLVRLIPLNKFKDSEVMPMPGMPVTIDNTPGIVKTVSSGRVLVDFNHPLSGKDVEFDVKVGNLVTDATKQLQSVLSNQFKDTTGVVNGTVATVTFPTQLPVEYHQIIEGQIKRIMPKLTAVEFKTAEKKAGVAATNATAAAGNATGATAPSSASQPASKSAKPANGKSASK